MNDSHFPTAHFGPEPVEIVCGDATEGWAAILFEDRDTPRDVDLIQLSAEDPQTGIFEAIETSNEIYKIDFEKHLPLKVRLPGDRVVIETAHLDTLLDQNAWEIDASDEYMLVQELLSLVRKVDLAHRQPRRFLFQHYEELPEERR